MNFKKFTLLSLSITFFIGGFFIISDLSNESEKLYAPRKTYFSPKTYSSQGYFEYMKMIRSNPNTGTVDYKDIESARLALKRMKNNDKSQNINWSFVGPDNVGGRTRAIVIDRNDTSHIMAGGISGGLWESFDNAVSWQPYDVDFKITTVSSIAQAIDGTFYVGTGSLLETTGFEFNGKGLGSRFVGTGFYKLTGNGGSELLRAPLVENDGRAGWAYIQEIATDPNDADRLLVATNRALKESIDGGQSFTDLISETCLDVEMTKDGKITATTYNQLTGQGTIHYSSDNGVTFNSTEIPGATRIEIAIAPSNTDIQYASCVDGNRCLLNVLRTRDAWQSYEVLPNPINFLGRAPGSPCGGQGFYDNEIVVYPNNPGRFMAGGISTVSWQQTSVDPAPIEGSFVAITINQLPPGVTTNPIYVHADQHKMVFNPQNPNTLFIGSDGGVTVSFDATNDIPTYSQSNFGYNVTQYYDIGVGPTGLVTGGTQDNGTQLMGLPFNTGKSGLEVNSGDGFDTELSTVNPTLGLVTSQFGDMRRLQGIGKTLTETRANTARVLSGALRTICEGNGDNCSPFYSSIRLWENFAHHQTNDSVHVVFRSSNIPPHPKEIIIPYESKNNDLPLEGVLSQDLFPVDTLPSVDVERDLVPRLASFDENTGVSNFVANFDTITVDRNTREVIIAYRGQAPDTFNFVFGTDYTYNNIFFDVPLTIRVDSFSVSYERAPIEFLYEKDFPDVIQTMTIINNVFGRQNALQRDVWMSRDVFKGGNVNEPRWFKIAGSRSFPDRILSGETILDSEFSKDGNYLFLATALGRVYRVKNLNDIDVSQIPITANEEQDIIDNIPRCELMGSFTGNNFANRAITGIALDPQDNNNIIITIGNYGFEQYIYRANNALEEVPFDTIIVGGTPTLFSRLDREVNFELIQGVGTDALPNTPIYDAIIDRQNSNRVLVATELGVFGTLNAFDTATIDVNNVPRFDVRWTEENTGLGTVPVMAIEQMTFTNLEGTTNEGKVYIGTHGRGAFVTDELVGIKENKGILSDAASFQESLLVFPNPLQDVANVQFRVGKKEPVVIQVFDIRGKLVQEESFNNIVDGENTLQMSFQDLSNGTYILRAIQDGNAASAKLIKN